MLTPAQEARLTQGGDCFDHYHSTDRVVVHDDLRALQQLASAQTITANFTVVNEDFLLADTTGGNITITLPRSKNGMEVEVTKITAANTMTVVPTGADTVQGTTSVVATIQWTSLRFKSIPGGWVLI